ncbi:MAG: hypothetical protein ACK59A_13195 [Cyanobacteriota bacterium]|jgi:hypothetical protein
MSRAWHRQAGWWGALLLAAMVPAGLAPVRAQSATSSPSTPAVSAFDVRTVQALLAKGDGAAAAGNLVEARRNYDQAREASKQLLGFYRDLSGAFRGLDARIPREMDDKGRQVLEALVQSNLRLAALFRRQNQPEVAVPLLVEVVKTMTPTSDTGRKAYQQLVEIGFVTTPYTAVSANPN